MNISAGRFITSLRIRLANFFGWLDFAIYPTSSTTSRCLPTTSKKDAADLANAAWDYIMALQRAGVQLSRAEGKPEVVATSRALVAAIFKVIPEDT